MTDEIERLQRIVRELREAWFIHHLYEQPHEWEWETTLAFDVRMDANREMRTEYDRQTIRLLSGDDSVPLTPRCAADMEASDV